MEATYRQYLENIYSSSPWSEFLDFFEANDPILDAHNLVFGPGGFGNIGKSPNLIIFKENPQNLTLNLMVCCMNIAGIREDCYVHARSGPWAHIKILDKNKWLNSIWGMQFPQTEDTVRVLLMLSTDHSQALYFAERDRALEVYIRHLTASTSNSPSN